MKRAAENRQSRVFPEQRTEERQPYDVVPVDMGENKRVSMLAFSQQKVPQSSDPRSRVYDDNTVARCSDFDTGGITAITVIIAPRDWYGTPGAPAANQHAILSLSEVLTFDRLSFLPRHKGKDNHTPKGRQYVKNKRFR
jgi:hypothetical protein